MPRQVISGLIQATNPLNDESRSVADIQAAMFEKHLPMIHDAGKNWYQLTCQISGAVKISAPSMTSTIPAAPNPLRRGLSPRTICAAVNSRPHSGHVPL